MIANTWDPALYDGRHAFVTHAGQALLDLLDARPDERVLDLGCGTGHHVAQLAARGARVIGVDADPTMIDAARAAHPGLDFRVGDGARFEVEVAQDAVFSNAALHWMREPDAVIARVRAALRPGGRFVAEMGGHGNIAAIIAAAGDAAREVAGVTLAPAWYFPTLGEQAARLEAGGFRIHAAWWFERPTPLEGEAGMTNWLRMFGGGLWGGVPEGALAEVVTLTEQRLRNTTLHVEGRWVADYCRLRFVAVKA